MNIILITFSNDLLLFSLINSTEIKKKNNSKNISRALGQKLKYRDQLREKIVQKNQKFNREDKILLLKHLNLQIMCIQIKVFVSKTDLNVLNT